MRSVILPIFILLSTRCFSQQELPFGEVNVNDMMSNVNATDTSASVLVIREFGHASIRDEGEVIMRYFYHVRMKILKPEGLSRANVAISLYKDKEKDKRELLRSVKASSYNIENGVIREHNFNPKEVFTETNDMNWDTKKFAIPAVQVGSVIDYEYVIETPTPWFYNSFKTWTFQSDIPKLNSEFWATIPANWRYNIALRGPLELKKNESEVLDDYFDLGGGMKSDCVRYRWAISNVPAFYEEEYMTSKKNFISAINFELLQIEYFDGRKDKITKEWKDVEYELKTWEKFGLQLKRGKDIVDEKIEEVIAKETDPLTKAKKIYDFIRKWYHWNEYNGYYTENGIKKAFDQQKGNVGDINLSLVAALRYAGLNTEPMILSTRDNGLPTELFPVLTDFNYVVAKLNIGDQVYLLDATDDFLPFGLLPERCLNGKGRVFGEKESYWHEIKPTERSRHVSMINLVLNSEGVLTGTIKNSYGGYKAAKKRRDIYSAQSVDAYIKELKGEDSDFEIVDYAYENLEDFSKSLVETLTVKLENADFTNGGTFFFNPYLGSRWTYNPFHLSERLYPVDFGVPLEETVIFTLEHPVDIRLTDYPQKAALALPTNGGRYLHEVKMLGPKVMINSSLVIGRSVFTSDEYPYVKELFNQVVKVQQHDLVFEKGVK